MAKNKTIFDLGGVDPVVEVSKHLSKKGKLQGNKKEKKALRSICPHHTINKKGRIKPRVHPEGGKMCTCEICRDRFKAGFYDDQEFDQAYRKFKPIASQGKLLAQAVGAGHDTVKEVSTLNLYIDRYEKTYKNLRNIAQKQDKAKKKKKNKKNKNTNLGSWKVNK